MIKFDQVKHFLDRAKKQQILPVISDATYQTLWQVFVANGAHNTVSPPRLDNTHMWAAAPQWRAEPWALLSTGLVYRARVLASGLDHRQRHQY